MTEKIDFESQILALFDTSPLTQFSKFNNFLWVCRFLGKNISNFVPPVWKLHNPYCHNQHPIWLDYRSVQTDQAEGFVTYLRYRICIAAWHSVTAACRALLISFRFICSFTQLCYIPKCISPSFYLMPLTRKVLLIKSCVGIFPLTLWQPISKNAV